MHHFSKNINKKMWYHIALSLGSTLVAVALIDTISSLSWLCKDHHHVSHYSGDADLVSPIHMMDIIYWVFVSYRMILSSVICIGGIFMGKRILVITWLVVSLSIDLIHVSETTFILSRPNLARKWPALVALASCLWQELKIVRIKYRIIRRILLVEVHSDSPDDDEYEPQTIQNEINSHYDFEGKFHFNIFTNTSMSSEEGHENSECFSLVCTPFGNMYHRKGQDDRCTQERKMSRSDYNGNRITKQIATNAVHFIKLIRNLYNLLTWHFTGYLFSDEHQYLIHSNHTATFLEESFVQYARIFLDVLTVIYIVQEKRLLLTPWIMAYIMSASVGITLFLFTLLYFNLLSTLFASIYYAVFSIDLFFRFSFLIVCIRYIVKTKEVI